MATRDEKRQKFISLLHALFQLDQPDLDFGFYRIMHAKAGQVSRFLEEDLLGIIHEAFGEADEARIAEEKAGYEAERKKAVDYGASDPDATEPVKIESGDSGAPELVIQFQYRVDPDETGQEGTWRKKRLASDNVVLNSFIVTPTRFDKLNWGKTFQELEDMHVLFMEDKRDTYVASIIQRMAA